jgi:hypothetical protein
VIDFKNLTNPSPLGTASSLSRKMNFMKDEDMAFIHKKPFIYETLDVPDIEARISLMVPSKMYVIWHSLSHKEAAN